MATSASAPPSGPTPTPTPLPPIPHIHLLCMHDRFADAFTRAATTAASSSSLPFTYTIHPGTLSHLPPALTFTLMVSPANSYGLLDGGFDDAISRALSPRRDYYALTRRVQRHLHARCRGYLPPGGAEIVALPREWTAAGPTARDAGQMVPGSWAPEPPTRNVWGCRYLAVCPTMRVPDDAAWDREVVYECVWSLLCRVDEHNRRCVAEGSGSGSEQGEDEDEVVIESMLMTPLGTGVGGISARRWAEQTVLALRHFAEARAEGSRWGALDWQALSGIDQEVQSTWRDGDAAEG